MSIIPSASTNDTSPAFEAKIYDSLVAFNGVACWDILRLAQMRQYLAEHLVNDLAPELDRLRAQVAELEAQRDRRRGRLVALQNDALNMRGSLSPHGEARKVPFELGETLTPAVDWLINRVAELQALAPAPIQTCRSCGAGYDYGQPCSLCEFKTRMAAELARPGAEEALLVRIVTDDEDEGDEVHPPHPAPCRHPASPDCLCPDPEIAAIDRGVADPHDRPRRRQVTPMQALAHDVETVIAPLTGDAKAGAEMVLNYIRTLAADATIPTTEDAS